MRSLETKSEQFPTPMLGRLIKSVSSHKKGRIEALGTSWPAVSCVPDRLEDLVAGKYAYVIARQDNTLFIAPEDCVRIQSRTKPFAYTVLKKAPKAPKAPKERVAVFIDASNLFYSAKQLNMRIDYRNFLHHVVGGRKLSGAFFYTGVDSSKRGEKAFLDRIQRAGYCVIQKELIKRSDRSKKANLDVEIALDMVMKASSNEYDTAILASGDGDFIYAIDTIKKEGRKVEVVGLRSSTSKSLIRAAERYTNLANLPSSVLRQRHISPIRRMQEDFTMPHYSKQSA